MATKFYAVRKGKVPGIYTTWPETQEQTQGFSGAEYKSFKTKDEAEDYLGVNKKETTSIQNISTDEQVFAYVDGSFEKSKPDVYGSGIVLLDNEDNVLEKLSIPGNDPEYAESNNIAGEICATLAAITYAVDNGYKQITIYHDYQGIKSWAVGDWKANKPISKDYVQQYNVFKEMINIIFVKVAAHTGVQYNELADHLAKNAISSGPSKTENQDGSVSIRNIDKDEFDFTIGVIAESLGDKLKVTTTNSDNCEFHRYRYLDDHVTVNYYFTKGTIQIQGNHTFLYHHLMSFFIQLLPDSEEVIETMNEIQDDRVSIESVESTFSKLLPNYKFEDQKLDNSLHQAIQNYESSLFQYDYTYLVMPILRALEYYLHKTLKKANLTTVRSNGSNNFSYFEGKNPCTVQIGHRNKFSSNVEINYVEKLYNFYHIRRHSYFHWDEDSTDTAVIEDINVARDIIDNACQIINEYYTIY
jgi:Predicted double-stranded RNA/RNA-DNA hybrid binding protein